MTGKILVIGGSGLIGARIAGRFGPDFVTATYCSSPMENGVHFDATSMRLGDAVDLTGCQYSHAILLQAQTNIDACLRTPDISRKINVTGTMAIIRDLMAASITPIFASSDAVFSGKQGLRREDDPTDPILTYGRHKVEIENFLKSMPGPSLILRLAKVMGSFVHQGNILSDWLNSVMEGREILCAQDQILTPVNLDDVVDAVNTLITQNQAGTFHICGAPPLSRLALLQKLLSHTPPWFQGNARIKVCKLSDIPTLEKRPLDCSMSNEKYLSSTGMIMTTLDQTCAKLSADFARKRLP